MALCLTGCAIHPLPEDYARVGTARIVEGIRCEARRSVQDVAIERLRRRGHEQAASFFAADRHQFYRFKPSRLRTEEERRFFFRYIRTAFALDFTFDITEDNIANTQIDFVKLLTHGTASLALSANSERQRENVRKFVLADTFESLLDDLGLEYACPDGYDAANLVYPVTGRIGLLELVSTFVELNEENLAFAGDKAKAPVFADRLNFTTTFSGSVVPKVVLAPIGHAFQLADANLTNTASRTEKNTVYVGLSLQPTVPEKFALPPTVFARRDLDPGQQRAVGAINTLRNDLFLDRSAVVPIP